jgi:alpha-L-fucosidase 2
MIRTMLFSVALVCLFNTKAQDRKHNLRFDSIPTRWDEAFPMGNGMIGELVWAKDGKLRFSLDRADLWDSRPMQGLHRKEFSYKWVQEQVAKKDYKPVQDYFDRPYDNEPAPTKIPGGALEFNMSDWGKVLVAELDISTATTLITWSKGISLKSFVHASKPIGWFRFENIPSNFDIQLIAPQYNGTVKNIGDPVGGDDLSRLGYEQGNISKNKNTITYVQEGWGGFKYRITVQWKRDSKNNVEGVWTINTETKKQHLPPSDSSFLASHLNKGFQQEKESHLFWWKNYWSKSAISVPDSIIEKQWYQEQYKFGSTSRKGAPPISLQAIWTADNGRIPPWKGDYHHDLNTQLSYWPSYSGNHLDEGIAYLDHLDENKANYKRFTKLYFGVEGIAVPGVTTLDGTEMGGWIQYSLSPTVSSWLSHHYYMQWRYGMDRAFLKNRAYPWIKDVAVFLEQITTLDKNGFRKLPISSSPEINDNSLSAWFSENTNYDLSLMKFNFGAAKELATELELNNEASHWDSILHQFSDFSLSENHELKFAPSLSYGVSHRHFSHLMAIHPLGLIKWENGEKEREIIRNTISLLDNIGPDYWCGYSYAWESNIKARAKDGEGAAKALQIFANAFCSTNGFHLNGDQTKSGLSKFQYRPFTLEGNFAFAAGLQEMLLQSHAGYIDVMPAVPASWKNISFKQLRAEGAFLIDASKKDGKIATIKIKSEKEGTTSIKLPASQTTKKMVGKITILNEKEGMLTLRFEPGAELILTSN